MSIDDSALRDPRVLRLAKRLGWSRRETLGALLDVWAVAYDRADSVLPQEDIDIAAEQDNFSCDLVLVGLATQVDGGVRLRGAEDRIEYLNAKREAGRIGGLKSGESRRSKHEAKSKQCFADLEARGNPPDPVPDLVPDNPGAPRAHARDPGPTARPPKLSIPDNWQPSGVASQRAQSLGVDVAKEAELFRLHFRANGHRQVNWGAAFLKWLEKAAEFAKERRKPAETPREIRDL